MTQNEHRANLYEQILQLENQILCCAREYEMMVSQFKYNNTEAIVKEIDLLRTKMNHKTREFLST